jgi:hypothetical protein
VDEHDQRELVSRQEAKLKSWSIASANLFAASRNWILDEDVVPVPADEDVGLAADVERARRGLAKGRRRPS